MQKVITKRPNGRLKVTYRNINPSMTKQEFREERLISFIGKKYRETGILPQVRIPPKYGDFSSNADFHAAQNVITQAQEEFLLLPSRIRKRFQNDPGELIEFLNDPRNASEAAELGLVEREAREATPTVKPSQPTPEPLKPTPASGPGKGPDAEQKTDP